MTTCDMCGVEILGHIWICGFACHCNFCLECFKTDSYWRGVMSDGDFMELLADQAPSR